MNEKLSHWLIERLKKPLPGPMAGLRFEPHPRPWRHYDAAPLDARPAAVLILLYPHDDHWWLPLTLRPAHLPVHAGQVSLPGGAVEPDETSAEAAVREFHEELGDDGQPIEMLGQLSSLYVQASNYLVTPWVASVPSRPEFAPNPQEVEALIEARLVDLLNPNLFGSKTRTHEGQEYTAPHFLVQSHRVWGATCMILGELVTLLEEISDL
jgi:8-oxo-dGTP pyrophosphatase MutT (NUDIX family)